MTPPDDETPSITIRTPTPADGHTMWRLAEESGGLDLNSPYAYLLAGHHFAATSVVAETDSGRLVGFVVAYVPQDHPSTVFVWQVTTHPDVRGTGLGRTMLHAVIDQALARDVTTMTATVTPSNDASRNLFRSVARDRGCAFDEAPCFGEELFPEGHEPEHEITVGPISG